MEAAMSTEQYESVCREQFTEVKDQLGNVNAKLDKMHNRLFIDNGTLSVQTRIDRTDRIVKALLWVVTVVSAASLAQVGQNVVKHFGHERAAEVRTP